MKITRKDLLAWVTEKRTIHHRGEYYTVQYNGLDYRLVHKGGGDSIKFYKVGRGVFGLESNRKPVSATQ